MAAHFHKKGDIYEEDDVSFSLIVYFNNLKYGLNFKPPLYVKFKCRKTNCAL
jgi:hypothetical protein